MNSPELDRLARKHGISLTRPDPQNREVPISDATKKKVLEALNVELPPNKAAGHRPPAPTKTGGTGPEPKCYLPELLGSDRVWGISLQLYELRSIRDWGIGDFEDLRAMADLVGSLGGDFIGLNPLHAPFLADPDRCSPYEPSNRQQLNPLYIAVERVPGFGSKPELESRLEELRQGDLVDYARVAEIKLAVLRDLWETWKEAPEKDPPFQPADFDSFVRNGGQILLRHALFEAISLWMTRQGVGAGWHAWPPEYRSRDSEAVVLFEREHADEIRFHMWLQWIAHQQLTAAAKHAEKAGLRIGLYLDLAVGEAVDGSATWSEPELYVSKATIGSPPDPFATDGQDWRLAALLPSKIALGKQSPYRRMVSAAMRYAGAIRIDHAAALRRLFLVPLDSRPEDGAYVNYPQEDLLQILAETSTEYECLVIGEDLGTLPAGLQDDLSKARILSYRILSYEQGEDGFKPADAYPVLSLACISTHDHQTLAGWWRGADIKMRVEHGIVPPDITEEHVKERETERADLKKALKDAQAIPPTSPPSKTAREENLTTLIVGAHRFIAKTSSVLCAVRLADLTGEKRPTNIPGTGESYPNWRPKLSVPIEGLPDVPLLEVIAKAMREERPRR